MTPDIRWKQRFQNYKKALTLLQQGVRISNPDVFQKQGVIQCFEYTIELAWKTLQDFMIHERGYDKAKGPRPVLQQAFQDELITDGIAWFDMLDSRNKTVHLYSETEVDEIYTKVVQKYMKPFEDLCKFFEAQP